MGKSLVSCFFDSRCISRRWNKVPEGITVNFRRTGIPDNTVENKQKETYGAKTSTICPAVSIQHRLVTDTQERALALGDS